MNSTLKKSLVTFVSYIPKNSIRVLLYRKFFNYQISKDARIGLGTRILVESANIGRVDIGVFNVFTGPMRLEIEDQAWIVRNNRFYCADWAKDAIYSDAQYLCSCKISSDTLITEKHFIDCTGGFELGESAWIAGRSSQFWTHGAGVVDRSIIIGRDSYIGSSVCFAPGVTLPQKSLVGLGSVVTKKFETENIFIAGNPAKIIKENYPGRIATHQKGKPKFN